MKHNLPDVPIFRDTPPGGQIESIALRVLVELPDWEFHVIGTATLIGGSLALTARHVVEASMKFVTSQRTPGNILVERGSLKLLQVLAGPVYRMFNVVRAWITSSDIAILLLTLDRATLPDEKVEWQSCAVRAFPPPSGQKVVAFGYRESQISVTKNADGSAHIDITDKPTTSAGIVGQIYSSQRDSSMLNFPCFEVLAQFAPGMSGGVVVDEDGWLCGLICAGVVFSDPDAQPLGYAVTLWPFLTTVISADRGDAYPRNVEYPAIDLALVEIIKVSHLEDLEPKYFPGRALPRRQQ
jgi:hypothetical protein